MKTASTAVPGPDARSEKVSPPALWIILVALVTARAIAAVIPGSWLWGLDALARMNALGWVLWVLSALSLVPAVARHGLVLLSGLGKWLEDGRLPPLAAATAAGLLVFVFPDQIRFVGDFLLRQGTAELAIAPARLYPQALPLDVGLHYALPTWASQTLGVDPNLSNRFLGFVNAAILALLALTFARRLHTRGAAYLAVAGVIFFGGWLALFTGFSKAFAEMTLLIVAMAVAGIDVLRARRGLWLPALLFVVGIWLHRSALGLIPAVVFLALISRGSRSGRVKGEAETGRRAQRLRRRVDVETRSHTANWFAFSLCLLSLGVLAPRLVASFRAIDVSHFSATSGGLLATIAHLVTPLRLLDDANLLLLLVPLAPLALLLLRGVPGKAVLARREWFLLTTLAAPFLALLVTLRPSQGLFRDLDTFAAGGMALAILVAAVVAETLRHARGRSWLAVSVAVGVAVPTLQWLMLTNDLDRSVARIQAWVDGPPVRSEELRARTWDFLGIRSLRAGRAEAAAIYLGESVELAPNPRVLLQWASACESVDNWEDARRGYELLLERAPARYPSLKLAALVGLARCSLRERDLGRAKHFARRARELAPGNAAVVRLTSMLSDAEELEPVTRP